MKSPTIPERMLDLLRDGEPHSVAELHSICGPSSREVVSFHIRIVRRKLVGPSERVLCVIHQSSIHYQLVTAYARP